MQGVISWPAGKAVSTTDPEEGAGEKPEKTSQTESALDAETKAEVSETKPGLGARLGRLLTRLAPARTAAAEEETATEWEKVELGPGKEEEKLDQDTTDAEPLKQPRSLGRRISALLARFQPSKPDQEEKQEEVNEEEKEEEKDEVKEMLPEKGRRGSETPV